MTNAVTVGWTRHFEVASVVSRAPGVTEAGR
jgi:hypothetical protein